MRRVPLYFLALTLPSSAVLAQTEDHAPVAMESSAQMSKGKGESWTYTRPGYQLASYKSVIIDPTAVYDGPDAQFEGISRSERAKFAGLVTDQLRTGIAGALPVVTRAGPGTARLRVTMLGMTETTGGVATATRVLPIGLATSALKSLAGKQGTLTGSMLVAVELFDAKTGELQVAAVRRRAPDALDVPATVSTTATVQSIARGLAKELRSRVERSR
jgi:hypothetical protein